MLTRYSSDSRGRAVRAALVYTKNEHGINKAHIDPEAIRIIHHLRYHGFDGYIVGGAVRDLVIGKTPKDFDIVTNAEPTKIKRLFRNSRIIGKRFRLVHIFFGPKIFEVSTFRSLADGTIGNSFGTIDEDVQRRDFTMNALYYDPIKEQVVDYVGGIKDLKKRVLQPVIPLKTIFKDDPVRMLRAIKYAVSTGCRIPFGLHRALKKSAPLLQPISPSRLTEEIIKILNSGRSRGIVAEALKYDLYMYLQPGAASLIDENRAFAEAYAKSLEELDAMAAGDEETRLGRKLVALVRDLVNLITDWKGNPSEEYNRVYNECRRFVMPMNPPRIELEYAVRLCLKEGGLNLRMPRNREKRNEEQFVAQEAEAKLPSPGSSGRPSRRRRRRRGSPPISASN